MRQRDESQPGSASSYVYVRRPTRVVRVGDVGIGGDHPIRVQSMTTTRTMDTDATVAQSVRLVEAGCEIVRITAPTVEDAANLKEIRERLRSRGVKVPLVADIHFNPRAALEAAKWVEKVRINPGNYADARVFARREYTDEEYRLEIERIEARLLPLIQHCKTYGVAMRIGTNHGSLSDRIMSRFGDTPEGMVESALEFVRICARHGYHDLVLSMKASNPKVMIHAYRLLAARMDAEGMDYPFHLGVTEAGSGVEARVKSAAGSGALLDDGIGDTIRVSLAEEPEAEIPVARALADLYTSRAGLARLDAVRAEPATAISEARDPFRYRRRPARQVQFGRVAVGESTPKVAVDATQAAEDPGVLDRLFARATGIRTWPDLVLARTAGLDADRARERLQAIRRALAARSLDVPLLATADLAATPDFLRVAASAADGLKVVVGPRVSPADSGGVVRNALAVGRESGAGLWVEADLGAGSGEAANWDEAVAGLLAAATAAGELGVETLALGVRGADPSRLIRAVRLLAAGSDAESRPHPIALTAVATPSASVVAEGAPLPLAVSVALGSLLVDGLGDLVAVEPGALALDEAACGRLAFDCLQAAGARSFKAEIVACPSCGRTLFDLQSTTARIKAKTGHLVGVKIAVMGCVVNGPGELADADFGYMGGAPGRVSLYVGRECVERNVPAAVADERLIQLIKSHGRWVEPPG